MNSFASIDNSDPADDHSSRHTQAGECYLHTRCCMKHWHLRTPAFGKRKRQKTTPAEVYDEDAEFDEYLEYAYNSGNCSEDEDEGLNARLTAARNAYFGHPPSPSPSFFRVFGACTCDLCAESAATNTTYPPEIREQKLKEYETWRQETLRLQLEAKNSRKERYMTHLALRRTRAMTVVAAALGMTEEEKKGWDSHSWRGWRKTHEVEAERWSLTGYESNYL
ncbi:hypothetical protein DFP72DRAFT_890753 [Ephemerocybe angulata]|uniref:Uncharacterized protein n=1 Tax=Ephemerocybe angulata TaxID=980116 RepID=A0A8H6I2W0_9AGAR|nr:hypothetical protein DFP72DRAFT_890753 [Tulosesus angulatus]